MVGVSLFSSAGIAEHYLPSLGIDIAVANEIVPERSALYHHLYPSTKMITGDITSPGVFAQIVDNSPSKVDFLLASPPCQGMSVAGKNRSQQQMVRDKRNFLVFKIIEYINIARPDYILIENVPNFFKILLPFDGNMCTVPEIMSRVYGRDYNIDFSVYDAADYGIAQRRHRAILKMYKKGCKWNSPQKQPLTTVRDAIGFLPSIEAGERSNIKWHVARRHTPAQVQCMRHTPTGESAMENDVFFPRKANGDKISAYNTTYRRMKWDEPAPTITIRNDAISSQQNVHPGRLLDDGTYSDARVLTPLELMLLSSLPADWSIPDDTPELLIRRCIGECIPPLLIKQIVSQITT